MKNLTAEYTDELSRLDMLTAVLASDAEYLERLTSKVALGTAGLAISASKVLKANTEAETGALDQAADEAMEMM